MKYEVEIHDREVSVQLDQSNGSVAARIGSRSYDLEVASPEPGVYTFFAGHQVYEARVSAVEADSFRVEIGGHLFTTRIIDRRRRPTTGGQGIEGRQHLVAPMPGKVVRVLFSPGEEVALGQGVIVVEAMKMQNEIKSPKSGRVIEVRVAEGATVNANQVLAVVE